MGSSRPMSVSLLRKARGCSVRSTCCTVAGASARSSRFWWRKCLGGAAVMRASCPTDETERTARGGAWTVACALAIRTAHPGTVPQHPGEAVATGGRVDAPGSWFPPHGCQWWREVAAVLPAGEHLKPRTLRTANATAWRRPHDPGRTAHVLQSIPHLAWVVLVCTPVDRGGSLANGIRLLDDIGGTSYNINHIKQWLTGICRA